jgi:hypothetical protein
LITVGVSDLGIRIHDKGYGKGTIGFQIEKLPIYGDGTYYMDVRFVEENCNPVFCENVISFKLEPKDIYGTGKFISPQMNTVYPGAITIGLE